MADVKTADKTVKHISQDATVMPEALNGGSGALLSTSSSQGVRGFARRLARQRPAAQLPETQQVLHPQAHARNSKAAAETKEDGLAA